MIRQKEKKRLEEEAEQRAKDKELQREKERAMQEVSHLRAYFSFLAVYRSSRHFGDST